MDRVMVVRQVGEPVDHRLVDGSPFGSAKVAPGESCQLGNARAHW
jgi:hypothetical protein